MSLTRSISLALPDADSYPRVKNKHADDLLLTEVVEGLGIQ